MPENDGKKPGKGLGSRDLGLCGWAVYRAPIDSSLICSTRTSRLFQSVAKCLGELRGARFLNNLAIPDF